jgi:hypothetical protein
MSTQAQSDNRPEDGQPCCEEGFFGDGHECRKQPSSFNTASGRDGACAEYLKDGQWGHEPTVAGIFKDGWDARDEEVRILETLKDEFARNPPPKIQQELEL